MEGDCHYLEGNLIAKRRIKYIQKLLSLIGMESERVAMVNVSSAMGTKFAQYAAEMTEQIRRLGPNPLRQGVRVIEPTD